MVQSMAMLPVNSRHLYRSDAGYRAAMSHYEQALRSWPVPYETHYVETRHGQTHVIVCGREDAVPLFIFHGWGSNAATLYEEYDIEMLSRYYRIYCPDTVGQSGRSAPNRPPTNGLAYGEWFIDLLDELRIVRSYVMGISGGGYLVLKAAAYAPERVIKGLAISAAGITGVGVLQSFQFMVAAVLVMLYPSPGNLRRFARAMRQPNAPESDIRRTAESLAVYFKHYKPAASGPALLTDVELSQVSAPIYMLMGQYECTFDTGKAITRVQQLIPNVQAEVVANAGHMLTLDAPQVVLARIAGFLC